MSLDNAKHRQFWNRRLLFALMLPAGLILACANSLPFLSGQATPAVSPTPTRPPGVAVEVTVVYLAEIGRSPEEIGAASPSPETTRPNIEIATPITPPPATDTPGPEPTDLPSPTSSPTLAQTGSLTPVQTLPAAAEPAPAPGGPAPNGAITLVEMPPDLTLPADVGPVEFKWVWNEVDLCEAPPDGQGFEVRIWPDLPGFGPVGVMDAAATQDQIVCDEKSQTRTLAVGNLRGAPGVQLTGSGQFRWEIALIELTEPYTPLAVSQSRTFQLPSDPTTPTPAPTLVPRVTLSCPCDDVGGEITLIELQDGVAVPPADDTIEFKWRWSQANGCEAPPKGYGFEVRIWPNRPEFGPMGAMGDATMAQEDIFCDPANGIRSYTVPVFKRAPGIEVAGAGEFRWDVILYQQEPYTEVVSSGSRTFFLPGESKLDQ